MKLYFRQYQNLTISGIYETSAEFSGWGATQNCKDYEVDTDAGTTRQIVQPKNGWLVTPDIAEFFMNGDLVGSYVVKLQPDGYFTLWLHNVGFFKAATRREAKTLIEKFWA